MSTTAFFRIGETFAQVVSIFASIAVLSSPPTESQTTVADRIELVDDALAVAVLPLEAPAMRPPVPDCEWTDEARTALTNQILIESSEGTDTAAIAWTMARRWRAFGAARGESFARYVTDTSRPLRMFDRALRRVHNPRRAAAVAQLTTHQRSVVFGTHANRVAVAAVLDAWMRGDVPDPCAGASFMWSSKWFDHGTTPVDCGDTANRFYELPGVSHDLSVARLSEPLPACEAFESVVASSGPPTPP